MEEKALHFDDNSNIYDDVRPGYPQEIYNEIATHKDINHNSRILEIGAGNGIASQEIYKNWKSNMVLVEPGENLCKLLDKKFKENKDIRIENTTYEDFKNEYPFDVIISATAFHWLDLSIKYKKSFELLKDDGLLIVFWNNYGIQNEEIGERIQQVYNKYGGETNDTKTLYEKQIKKIVNRKNEIEESNFFKIIGHKIFKNILDLFDNPLFS